MTLPTGRVAELADAQDSGSCVRKDVGVQLPPRPPPLTCEVRTSRDSLEPACARRFGKHDELGYHAAMLATFNDWMFELPLILQVLVAFAVLMAIGTVPLVLWLGYAVATTRDEMQAERDRTTS